MPLLSCWRPFRRGHIRVSTGSRLARRRWLISLAMTTSKMLGEAVRLDPCELIQWCSQMFREVVQAHPFYEAVRWVRGMSWWGYFVFSWGERGWCPWWERAAISREPGWAERGLAMPGWAALHPPMGTCSAGSISCCCTEPVTEIACKGGARALSLPSPQPCTSQPRSPARHATMSPTKTGSSLF